MKNMLFLFLITIIITGPIAVVPAHALSCLPVADYLKQVVGKDEFIFVATSEKRLEGSGYTSEVLAVTEAKQGFVPGKLFAHHSSNETWGYFCNSGPKAEGSTGLYIVGLDEYGKYVVYQRLELTDPLVETLDADLKRADVTGEVTAFVAADRSSQILATIGEFLRELGILLKEYTYWK